MPFTIPKVNSLCGLSLRSAAMMLSVPAAIISLVNAVWDWLNLVKYSHGLGNFKKVTQGLQAIFLTLLFFICIIGFFALMVRKVKLIAIYAKIIPSKFVILLLLGLIHLISIAKSKDRFIDSCQNGFGFNIDTSKEGTCDRYYDIRVGIAVALYLVEELVLALLTIVLKSYLPTITSQSSSTGESESYKYTSGDLEADPTLYYSRGQTN